MGKLLATLIPVLATLSCLHAQDQERKLVDRLLKPDMTLQSSEQKKTFLADGTSVNKKANVGTFYVEKKSKPKKFSGTRELSTQQFNSRVFQDHRSARENSPQQAAANSRRVYQTQSVPGARDASQSDKRAVTGSYAGNRPFLDQGKSQKSLNQKNAPLTIDQVRELLNKNK